MEHDVSAFKEGRDTTLVIKDTGNEGGREEGRHGKRKGGRVEGKG